MKKRYFVSLDQSMADQVKADLDALSLPAATFSNIINEWMTAFAPTLHMMADRKRHGEQLTFDEVLGSLASEMGKALTR